MELRKKGEEKKVLEVDQKELKDIKPQLTIDFKLIKLKVKGNHSFGKKISESSYMRKEIEKQEFP